MAFFLEVGLAGVPSVGGILVLALAVAPSFVPGAPLNRTVHTLYSRLEPILARYPPGSAPGGVRTRTVYSS